MNVRVPRALIAMLVRGLAKLDRHPDIIAATFEPDGFAVCVQTEAGDMMLRVAAGAHRRWFAALTALCVVDDARRAYVRLGGLPYAIDMLLHLSGDRKVVIRPGAASRGELVGVSTLRAPQEVEKRSDEALPVSSSSS